MSDSIDALKTALRREAIARRDALTPASRATAAEAIAARPFPVAIPPTTVVAGFMPIRSEIDPRPLLRRLDAQHVGVRDERARTAAKHRAASRHVVELHETVRDEERVVIRQAGDAGAEHDVPGPLGRGRDHQLG